MLLSKNQTSNFKLKSHLGRERLVIKYNEDLQIITLDNLSSIITKKINCKHSKKDNIICDLTEYYISTKCTDIKNNKLDLSKTQLGCKQIIFIITDLFLTLVDLQELDMSNLNLGLVEEEIIEKFCDNFWLIANLEIINLSNNRLNNNSVTKIFEKLPDLVNLKQLILKNNEIGDEALENLENSINDLSHLEIINLQNNLITTTGAVKFIDIINNPTIKSINLQFNKIDKSNEDLIVLTRDKKKHILIDYYTLSNNDKNE